MNTKTKKRMVVVSGIIVIVLVVVLAVVGGNSAARAISVAEAIELHDNAKVQVTGNVVEDSFSIEGNVLTFAIYDAKADPGAARQLAVRYDGGVSATFGNDVTAICTGKKGPDDVLVCSELVTKCPSKYENAEGSLSIADLRGYGDSIVGKPVKVSGVVKEGTLAGVDADVRFVLLGEDAQSGSTGDGLALDVRYSGALSGDVADGARVIATGSLRHDGSFQATDIALGV